MTKAILIRIILFTILLGGTVILRSFLSREKKEGSNILKKRKEQSKDFLTENLLKKKINEYTEKKVDVSKRFKVETICLQAGFNFKYSDYLCYSVLSAFIVGLSVGIAMHNPLLSIMFLFIGYSIPGQIITFIRNKRVDVLEKQIGSFMQMTTERYKNTKDFKKAIDLTLEEFRGEEPMYSEIRQTSMQINLGVPVGEALDGLARRTGNKYLQRFSDYYKICSTVGTEEIRNTLLNQSYLQFEESRKIKMYLKKEIAGPKREAYIMLASIPMFALYQVLTNDKYVDFMINTLVGKIGTATITAVFLGCIWFVNNKIGAPIE